MELRIIKAEPLILLVLVVVLTETAYLKQQSKSNACETTSCKKTAEYFLENINESIDPCVDFYQFACGNFIKNTPIPQDKDGVDSNLLVNEQIMIQLRDGILNLTTKNPQESFTKLRLYYDTCVNQEQSSQSIRADYDKILQRVGGWPVLGNKYHDQSNFDWRETMYKFRDMGFPDNFFVHVVYSQDLENSTLRSLYVGETQLSYPRWFLSQDRKSILIEAYFTYMVDVSVALGANEERAKVELEKVLQFEMDVAKQRLPDYERVDIKQLNNRMTLGQLQSLAPQVPWLEHLGHLFYPYLKFRPKDRVIVTNPDFLHKFLKLLSATPKRVQANYALWRLTQESLSYLQNDLRVKRAVDNFKNALGLAVGDGVNERKVVEPQWHKCVALVSRRMFLATAALYVRNYFDKDAKQAALILSDNVLWSLKDLVTEMSWISLGAQGKAQSKLDAVIFQIGYPDQLLNDTALDYFHRGLVINRESFWMTELNYNQWFEGLRSEQYDKPVDKMDWTGEFGESVTTSSAIYDSQKNIIRFPAGILQGAFFDNDNAKYVNYGTIGSAMGHELWHAIDEIGSKFDSEGNLSNDTWDPLTQYKYSNRAQCFIGQYNNYHIDEIGLYVNGRTTMVENMSDSVGLLAAYKTYVKWSKFRKAELPLPGFEKYSPRQLFWLANANFWCSKERPSSMRLSQTHDKHSPNRYRVNGPMSNLKEFARDFECEPGTPMNPVQKCSVL
ncbi:hypothetical protein QAD02_008899 [Eretmocerus hayati]|uniref:Uncharacterized protein n=1 Tax=Eretmocerus hayati TaxID=131215 RepID=A0ACC2N857_9HYME|nr:hypothetical protein QAD02_008899 [Eretmocerus hayati]